MYQIGDIMLIDDTNAKAFAEYCNNNHLQTETIVVNDKIAYKIISKQQLSLEDMLSNVRQRRQLECFNIINRGQLWYNNLSDSQIKELKKWYQEWLDITKKCKVGIDIESIIPTTPKWLV